METVFWISQNTILNTWYEYLLRTEEMAGTLRGNIITVVIIILKNLIGRNWTTCCHLSSLWRIVFEAVSIHFQIYSPFIIPMFNSWLKPPFLHESEGSSNIPSKLKYQTSLWFTCQGKTNISFRIPECTGE